MPSRPESGRLSPSAQAADFRRRALQGSASPNELRQEISRHSSGRSQAVAAPSRHHDGQASSASVVSARPQSNATRRRDVYMPAPRSRSMLPHAVDPAAELKTLAERLQSIRQAAADRNASTRTENSSGASGRASIAAQSAARPKSRSRSPRSPRTGRGSLPGSSKDEAAVAASRSRTKSSHLQGYASIMRPPTSRHAGNPVPAAHHTSPMPFQANRNLDSLQQRTSRCDAPMPPSGSAAHSSSASADTSDSRHAVQQTQTGPKLHDHSSIQAPVAPTYAAMMQSQQVNHAAGSVLEPVQSSNFSHTLAAARRRQAESQHLQVSQPTHVRSFPQNNHSTMLRRHNRSQGAAIQDSASSVGSQHRLQAGRDSQHEVGSPSAGQLSVSQRIKRFESNASGGGLQVAAAETPAAKVSCHGHPASQVPGSKPETPAAVNTQQFHQVSECRPGRMAPQAAWPNHDWLLEPLGRAKQPSHQAACKAEPPKVQTHGPA